MLKRMSAMKNLPALQSSETLRVRFTKPFAPSDNLQDPAGSPHREE